MLTEPGSCTSNHPRLSSKLPPMFAAMSLRVATTVKLQSERRPPGSGIGSCSVSPARTASSAARSKAPRPEERTTRTSSTRPFAS